MNTANNGTERGFCIAELVVATIVCLMAGALLAPALAQSRVNANRLQCMNNAKQIVLALHNHHDTRKVLPLASTRMITAKPGHFGDADAAGYSWLVQLSPFLEEGSVWQNLIRTSNKLQKDLYDPAVTSADGVGGLPSREQAVPVFLCPSFVAHLQGIDESAHESAPDPKDPNANPLEAVAKPPIKLPPISNYHALAGSHFYNQDGLGRMLPAEMLDKLPDGRVVPKRAYEGNGVLEFPGMVGGKLMNRGIGFAQIADGSSNTLVFAETIEPQFASWLDGQVTWLVAAWPSNPDVPTEIDAQPSVPGQKVLGWTDSQLPNNWTSLGKHGTQGETGSKDVYLPAARWSGAADRVWGPSSYHDGQVTHGFADGHVKMLSADIDKNVYLCLVTRSGREVILPEIK